MAITRREFGKIVGSAAVGLVGNSLVGCSRDYAVTRETAGDVEIIRNPAEPRFAGGSLERFVQIGRVDGPQEQLFERIPNASLGEGILAVLDSGSLEVRLFDPEGTYLGAIGGRGDGPGEFTAMNWGSVHVGPDRISVIGLPIFLTSFARDGSYLDRFSLPSAVLGVRRVRDHIETRDGYLLHASFDSALVDDDRFVLVRPDGEWRSFGPPMDYDGLTEMESALLERSIPDWTYDYQLGWGFLSYNEPAGEVYFVREAAPHSILVYGLDGSLRREIMRPRVREPRVIIDDHDLPSFAQSSTATGLVLNVEYSRRTGRALTFTFAEEAGGIHVGGGLVSVLSSLATEDGSFSYAVDLFDAGSGEYLRRLPIDLARGPTITRAQLLTGDENRSLYFRSPDPATNVALLAGYRIQDP